MEGLWVHAIAILGWVLVLVLFCFHIFLGHLIHRVLGIADRIQDSHDSLLDLLHSYQQVDDIEDDTITDDDEFHSRRFDIGGQN